MLWWMTHVHAENIAETRRDERSTLGPITGSLAELVLPDPSTALEDFIRLSDRTSRDKLGQSSYDSGC
jgi:hypothetical protein